MDLRRKLTVLADAAKYDASCASSGSRRARPEGGVGNGAPEGICHSYTPDGRCVSLLKILLTNVCVYDCQYCVNRISSDIPRARFSPEEVVTLTLDFYRRNYIEGLFLSSGVIKSADHTMELLVRVGRLLRTEHRFGGYIHLKAVPGASPELLRQAGLFADRLSVNVELPTQADLARFAPEKRLDDVESSMGVIRAGCDEAIAARREPTRAPAPVYAPAGQSTQMIVGVSGADDATILSAASHLYHRHALRRVYYSAFSPIPGGDPRLPGRAPPLVREHRLYEADWLVRQYGFNVDEIVPSDTRHLDLEIDPKLAWALRHRQLFPVDVQRAPRELLLRVPGLGVRNVDRLLSVRRHRRVTTMDLRRLGVAWKRARHFVLTADQNPALRLLDSRDLPQRLRPAEQLSLFDTAKTARSGQL